MSSKKILLVTNVPEFFLSHRLPVALAAKKSGYEVHVATAYGPEVDKIQAQGFTHHIVPFSRSGQKPLNELVTLLRLIAVFRKIKPSLVHLITIKPVVYGGIAARIAGVRSVVCAVSGLGTVFLAETKLAQFRKWFVSSLYQSAFKHKQLAVIFQNPDDRDTLVAMKVLRSEQVRMIRGSGVNLEQYPFVPEPDTKPVVVMAARLLRDKGVFEFVEAARILVKRGVDVQMRLIGSPDPGNLTSVTQQHLALWAAENHIELLGYRTDIAKQYAAANIVCLPSYREGLPKGLVEAAACGRVVVTTNVPGCRDAISPNETGLLVPVKDAVALADAIQKLVESPGLRKKMGIAGRALAEEAYAIEKIVAQHMEIYQEMLEP